MPFDVTSVHEVLTHIPTGQDADEEHRAGRTATTATVQHLVDGSPRVCFLRAGNAAAEAPHRRGTQVGGWLGTAHLPRRAAGIGGRHHPVGKSWREVRQRVSCRNNWLAERHRRVPRPAHRRAQARNGCVVVDNQPRRAVRRPQRGDDGFGGGAVEAPEDQVGRVLKIVDSRVGYGMSHPPVAVSDGRGAARPLRHKPHVQIGLGLGPGHAQRQHEARGDERARPQD
ncbi:hypothetical protein BU14_0106s0018 [Porphyra umbilicalis]|uniref:Uncharacterized protein n=1 Tax=Porphyra umbilicalis TaxID=2786 RepID=A0A1X6PCF7_PORUM|nr:hypothetical protein BU14_0106s0018 [Porphyra umbilicalis]|eukprot:OSX78552.1 hypothetical protein BU14_0106s0018 [Porphyra umbilicalis]